MEAIGIVARLSTASAHDIVHLVDDHLATPLFGAQPQLSLLRRALITWFFLYAGALLVYFAFATLDYLVYFKLVRNPQYTPDALAAIDMRREIMFSVRSLVIMSGLSTPAEVLVQLGYGKVYTDPWKYGIWYLILSPLIFIAFSDCLIYFIHRGLHHRYIYKTIHKPHHSFVYTSPFAAFAFHPLDGYAQGIPYQLFVFLVPLHSVVHLVSLVAVSMWTINIHDGYDMGIPGVNGAGHHYIHHTTFKSNYGQYFTLWDKIGGTFRDPRQWRKAGAHAMTEKEVYGKDA